MTTATDSWVADFIHNGAWSFPALLELHFPIVCDMIRTVPIAMAPNKQDQLIWSPFSSGELTAKEAFHFLRPHLPVIDWGKHIWSKFIIPRISLHVWKVLRGRVLSEDLLQRRGICLASRCVLCGINAESLLHVFMTCPFSASIWDGWMTVFNMPNVPTSLLDLLNMGCIDRSSQVKEVWLITFTTTLWFIWRARNKMKHDNCVVMVKATKRLIMGHVKAASKLASGTMYNSVSELQILHFFGVGCRPRRTPRIIEVNWIPPIIGWVKINTDGACQHVSGRAGYGGVFRDFHGSFMGAFASNLDIPSSIDAEIMAVIQAIELAWVREWKHIWLEVDSTLVLNFLRAPHLVPWRFRVAWYNCLHRISQMHFKSSHIFREGNQVADALANVGMSSTGLVWWNETPPFLLDLCRRDSLGLSNFRFN